MAKYGLRAATAADQPDIKSLIRSVRINPLSLNWRNFVVAVADNDELIGCGQVKSHRDGSRELASIAVKKGWRRQGAARAIIHHLMAEHRPPLWLTCRSGLVPFYRQFGFREVTAAAGMPPYFGRVQRLFCLFSRLSRSRESLAVMVWNAEKE